MNKITSVLTIEQYNEIIEYMMDGFVGHQPNLQVAVILMIIADTGKRLRDVLKIRREDIYFDNNLCFVEINESFSYELSDMTGIHLEEYILKENIQNGQIFKVSERCVQKNLKSVCNYLEYDNIGVVSFRKFNYDLNKARQLTITRSNKTEISLGEKKIAGVYSIRSKRNGRIYIGESDDIAKRWEVHKKELREQKHRNELMQNDYNRFGEENFVWSVLAHNNDEQERKTSESNFIHALGTIRYGYNIRP